MTSRTILITGSVAGMLAVMLGAFGAHGLHETLLENGRTDTYKLAVDYQFYHALSLLAVGILSRESINTRLKYATLFFITGIILFSGSLYILSVANYTKLGMITPLGGLSFIAGWLLLILDQVRRKN